MCTKCKYTMKQLGSHALNHIVNKVIDYVVNYESELEKKVIKYEQMLEQMDNESCMDCGFVGSVRGR